MENLVGNLSYANQTTVNAAGLTILLILGISTLFLPRRWAVLPILVMACFVSSAQRIVVFNFDLNYLRVLLLVGILRIVIRGEYTAFTWCRLDKVVILWAVSATLFYTLRNASLSALVNRLGFSLDAIGMYLLFRCLIREWGDVENIVKGLVWISIPLSVFFIIENRTGRNLFSVFGGVPAITVVREGRLRCQGAFSHPILAGCFWAAAIPLFAAVWWKSIPNRIWAILGTITALLIIVCCASSTPVLGVLAAGIGAVTYSFRKEMRTIRLGLVGILVILHVSMNAPVWQLVARVSAVGGSTGWHRFLLIDRTITNFPKWFLMGCSGEMVASWGIWMADVTNQYVLEGVNGGFVTLCLFVYCIVIAFREIGKLWRRQKSQSYEMKLAWALGIAIFVHCMQFIGVSYFGQANIQWYLLLAIIGSLSTMQTKKCVARATYPVRGQYELA